MNAETATRAERIQEAARALIGVPFIHQGRSSNGTDCVGLAILAGKAAGAVPEDYDYREYGWPGEQRAKTDALEAIAAFSERMKPEEARAGDVAAFVIGGETHLGVLTAAPDGELCLVHADARRRRVVEHRIDDAWKLRMRAAFRVGGGE